MTGLTNDEARALLGEAFANLVDPSEDVETLSRYFSPTCVQEIDGEVMDYSQFLDHARAIKRSIRSARVTFEALIVEAATIADIWRCLAWVAPTPPDGGYEHTFT
jgi:hypothetical protein